MHIAAVFLLPVVLIALPPGVRAQLSAAEPAPGVFLVAKPEMPDPRFQRSVILLLAHDDGGTVGLVVNRPTGVTVPNAPDDPHPIYLGGPVDPDRVVVLGRGERPQGPFQRVWEDVWWSTDRGAIEALLGGSIDADALRVFLGYTGWAPGQLDAELAVTDAWALFRADPGDVFSPDSDDLWNRFMGRNRPLIVWHRSPVQDHIRTRIGAITLYPGCP